MRTIIVDTAVPYDITVGEDLFPTIGSQAKTLLPGAAKYLVVTDSNVAPLSLEKLCSYLRQESVNVYTLVLGAGEQNKTFESYRAIVTEAAKLGFCRDDAFFALGGGVVGDLTGFAASSYMRGIRYIQVPTTLLAGIDAAIGGKTGFDLPEGKNLVGAFYQPKAVFFDVETLRTLPKAEIKNGMGEGLKYAVLCGGRIEYLIENNLLAENLEEFCALCAQYKAEIVAKDEKEGNVRALLNLGHTPGHAIEKLSSYTVPHGEAVAMGIKIMAKAALKDGVLSATEYEKILSLLRLLGFTDEPPFATEQIALSSANDKKVRSSGINVIEIAKIGDCRIRKMSLEKYGEYIK